MLGHVLTGPGAVISIPDPGSVNAVLAAGYAWAIIDTEHSAIDPSAQVWLTAVIQGGGAAALVRVPANDPHLIGIALDGGADGVIVPGVEGPDAAARAAMAVRYPPKGTRSIGRIRRQQADPLCILQIESKEAVGSAGQITAVDGVDAVMVGPGDLALSLGRAPGTDHHHPDLRVAYRHIIEVCRTVGRPVGTFALLGPDDIRAATATGWDFIATFHDRIALTRIAAADKHAADGVQGHTKR